MARPRWARAWPSVGVFNPVGIVLFGVAGTAGWTAISGYCPLYSVLGISTCPLPQQD